jgi:hypothetical protein
MACNGFAFCRWLGPIYHPKPQRIEAHLFVAFLADCLSITLRQRLKAPAGGLMPQAVQPVRSLPVCCWGTPHWPTLTGPFPKSVSARTNKPPTAFAGLARRWCLPALRGRRRRRSLAAIGEIGETDLTHSASAGMALRVRT